MPVTLNAVDLVTLGMEPGFETAIGSWTTGAIQYGGNLFMVLAPLLVGGPVSVWKSTDGGLTWTKPTAVGQPSVGVFKSIFDGTSKITVVYTASAVLPDLLQFKDFDLVTESWGAAYGVGGPSTGTIHQIVRQSSGNLLVFFQDAAGLGDGVVRYRAAPYTGAWGAAYSVQTNFPNVSLVPNASSSLLTAVVDPADTVHVFFQQADATTGDNSAFYQHIGADLVTLAGFNLFDDTTMAQFTGMVGSPCILGTDVFFPVIRAVNPFDSTTWSAAGFIGTGLAAPVWGLIFPIDPGFIGDPTLNPRFPPVASTDGVTVFASYICQSLDGTFPSGRIRWLTTLDLSTWVGITAFNIQTEAPPGFIVAGAQSLLDPRPLGALSAVSFNALDPTGSTFQRFWLTFGAGAPVTLIGSPGTAQVGTSYTFAPVAGGGTPPYTFSISAGSLPPGLTLKLLTGVVSGTPTTMGVFCFSITVTDSLGATAVLAVCITVYGAVLITLYGWKLYPDVACADTVPGVELPPVKRAI